MRCVAFPFAFLRQEIATHERGVRLGFQPLLSLKGDAQAFKNAVCVWNLSGAKFGHTKVWQRMARHFRFPSKWEEQERRKSFQGGVDLGLKRRGEKIERQKTKRVWTEKMWEEKEKRKKESRWNPETFRWRLKAIHVRSINQKEKSFLTHTHKSFWENNNHSSLPTRNISRTHTIFLSPHPHSPVLHFDWHDRSNAESSCKNKRERERERRERECERHMRREKERRSVSHKETSMSVKSLFVFWNHEIVDDWKQSALDHKKSKRNFLSLFFSNTHLNRVHTVFFFALFLSLNNKRWSKGGSFDRSFKKERERRKKKNKEDTRWERREKKSCDVKSEILKPFVDDSKQSALDQPKRKSFLHTHKSFWEPFSRFLLGSPDEAHTSISSSSLPLSSFTLRLAR